MCWPNNSFFSVRDLTMGFLSVFCTYNWSSYSILGCSLNILRISNAYLLQYYRLQYLIIPYLRECALKSVWSYIESMWNFCEYIQIHRPPSPILTRSIRRSILAVIPWNVDIRKKNDFDILGENNNLSYVKSIRYKNYYNLSSLKIKLKFI